MSIASQNDRANLAAIRLPLPKSGPSPVLGEGWGEGPVPRTLRGVTNNLTPDPEATPEARPVQPSRADAAYIETLEAVVAVHPNESHWWNHASFALPLLGCLGFVIAGFAFGSAEAKGFGLFLGAITLFMLPVVLLTWRGTPTSIVLTEAGALALHDGRVLRELRWPDVTHIDRVETMGNVRWRIHQREGQHLAIEGEITDVPALIDHARQLAGL